MSGGDVQRTRELTKSVSVVAVSKRFAKRGRAGPLVFVGGCTTGLFLTDPAAGGIRPTKDVDAIVDVTSYAKYASLAERLRALGLAEDTTPGAPLCRWRHAEMIVDVMPTDASVLGFSNRWYPAAIETARST